jgi:1-acyl-sn-glycerol-3-phosphate acyltransferase
VRTARDLLATGECLMVFPEGGVTRSGHMRPGFSGAGYLALQPEVVVVPAVIWNTQLFRGPVRMRFGPPIPMDELRASPRPGRNRRATERIMETLAEMVPSVGGPEQPPPIGTPWIPRPRGKGSIRS